MRLNKLTGVRYPLCCAISPKLHETLIIWQHIEWGAIEFRSIDIMNEGWLPRIVLTLCHCRCPFAITLHSR